MVVFLLENNGWNSKKSVLLFFQIYTLDEKKGFLHDIFLLFKIIPKVLNLNKNLVNLPPKFEINSSLLKGIPSKKIENIYKVFYCCKLPSQMYLKFEDSFLVHYLL